MPLFVDKFPLIHLNLLGFLCPIPVHETRMALGGLDKGSSLEVKCDDPETLRDIPALCDRLGVNLLSVKEESGEFVFLICK